EKAQGPVAQSGDLVSYSYEISMLNGSILYESKAEKPAQLLIDRQDAEIGLHDALKLMRVGDKGFFILPSHRAFGVAGDQNKVPPFTALVYKLEVLEIQNQNQQK
ncbi:MAG: FKBP-type peptidyl-prolyl cis-trans isomerase, partial [Croceimicrobium sp.]